MQTVQTQTKSEAQIQRDVLAELKWDTRIDEWDVGVEVDNAVVTLTGTVASYAKQLAAREAAHRVSGVLDVVNNIKVKLPGSSLRTDTDLAQAVRDALERRAERAAKRVTLNVVGGKVTVSGTIRSWEEKAAVLSAVRFTPGVLEVEDSLRIDAMD